MVGCLAQGHRNTQLGTVGDRTSSLPVTSQPPPPPELMLLSHDVNAIMQILWGLLNKCYTCLQPRM